ncbi:MAG: PLP-dependent aspartate aminotransferase family protein [Gemmatimonadota bacterium]|nr:MAG: PLP-dependent aspartate aminotransferase family protein [Gemmatimonadota bacterium]
MSDNHRESGLSTRAIHSGSPRPEPGAPVVPPVVMSSTFYGGKADEPGPLRYSRYGNNPNQEQVAAKMAALEGTEASLLLSSGMAAIALTVLSATEAGDHVVASRHLYGATQELFTHELPRRGIEVTFIDPGDEAEWRHALRERTRVLYLEVPTNPALRVFDPRVPASVANEHGLLFAVDTTFASPVNVRMADLGVHAVIHSATKYLGGHTDLIAGVVSGSRELVGNVRDLMKLYGPSPDPHMAWLLGRGLRTVVVRMARHNQNALALARWFAERPEVEATIYPGLESHPDHALACELLDGHGGMLSVILKGGGEAADAFAEAVTLALIAPSLGGVETLISQPRYTSHRHQKPEEREAIGVPDGFLRISVGLEDVDDLTADFDRALRESQR